MKLTPYDIREHEFTQKFRGYDVGEVASFLEEVAQEFDVLIRELQARGEEIERLKAERERMAEERKALREQEAVLRGNLEMINNMQEEMKKGAEREAQLLVKDAELEAREIIKQAERERLRMEKELAEMRQQRKYFEVKMRAVLETYLKMLDMEKEEDRQQAEEKVRFLNKGLE